MADIDDQSADNYHYDEIGNLVKDNAEGITGIKWSVYGKILEINKSATTNNPVTKIVYSYDAQGNRISKVLYKNNGTRTYTWYTRDAQGNVMATYSSNGANNTALDNLPLNVTERHIYGSSRLGIYSQIVNVDDGPADMSSTNAYKYYRGLRQYELSNHLGNVLATITDKKTGFDSNTDGTIDYYKPEIVTAQDYYPFGMLMPGRIGYASSTGWSSEPGSGNSGEDATEADIAFKEARENNLPNEYKATNSIEFNPGFESGAGDVFLAYISPAEAGGGSSGSGDGSLNNGYYRYGFNGKENDNEIKGVGNQQDYGMRIYDPRVGRFLSVDPLTKEYPWNSPYAFAENRVLDGVDLDGKEWSYYVDPNSIQLKIKIAVNVRFNVDNNLKLNPEQITEYQNAINKQFNRTLNLSSNSFYSGEVTFNNFKQSKQLIPEINIFGMKPTVTSKGKIGLKGGQTSFNYSGVNIYGLDGKYCSPELFALDAVHELLHTLRLSHPFEKTQSSDSELKLLSGNNYITGRKTDPNINYNIMNYNSISIDGQRLGNLWKEKKAELLTVGQIQHLLKEIDLQKAGGGLSSKMSQSAYENYWINYPGIKVETKK